MARRLALALFLLGAFLIITAPASSNHFVYLPLVPNTPLMQQVIKGQEYTYCLDSRAATYPNFASQVADVNSQYTAITGIRSRQVAFDASCQVRHAMPSGLSCDGWAAHIFYANWPVTIEYCYQLGYTDWRSAIGHELGHGVLGLHEQYNDSGGNIGCTRRTETVMDCGSGVRYPTPLDTGRGCAIIKTIWCGNPPAPPPSDVIYFLDGWGYRLSDQNWINPDGWPEWQPCNIFGERWNYHLSVVLLPGSAFYSRHFWSSAGAC